MVTSTVSRLGDSPEEGIKAPVVTLSTGNETKFGVGQTIASVVIADQDRVALAAQTVGAENGIWIARLGKDWIRASDFNANEDVVNGMLVVDANTTGVYSIIAPDPWRVDVDTVTFGLLIAPSGFFWGSITGTISNQGDLQLELDAKSDVGHTHLEADITDLQSYSLVGHTHLEADITDLQNYSLVGHTHVEADITDLQSYLTDAPVNSELYARSNGIWQVFTTSAGTIGEIVLWGHENVPANFLECNGQSINAVTFSKLFAVIGYQYGGSGANFNLPDLRGEFVRGYAHGSGNDPDRASRTDRGDGTTGDEVGTKQLDELRLHVHTYLEAVAANQSGSGSSGRHVFTSQSTGATGGSETRGRNVAMMYIIRYDGGGSGTLPPQVQVQDNGVAVTPAVELLNFLNFNLESLVANQVDIAFGASPNGAQYCPDYTFNFIDTTDWSIVGFDVTNLFSVGRRLRFVDGASNYYGQITAVDYNITTVGDTTMTMSMEDAAVLTATITEVCLVNGGVAWSPISQDPFAGTPINGIATGQIGAIQYWVIVGNTGQIATSINGGLSWTVGASGTTENLNDVAYNPDDESFLAVGQAGEYTHSTDGLTWTADSTKIAALPEAGAASYDMASVTYDIGGKGWRTNWEHGPGLQANAYSTDDTATWDSTLNIGALAALTSAKTKNLFNAAGNGGTMVSNGEDVFTFGFIPDETLQVLVNTSGKGLSTAFLPFIDSGGLARIYVAHATGDILMNASDFDLVTFGSSVVCAFVESPTHERIIAVAEDGKIGYVDKVDYTVGAFTLVPNGSNPLADFTDVDWNSADGVFVAVNNQGQILRSANGTN